MKEYTILDDPDMQPFLNGLREKVETVVEATKSPSVPTAMATDMLVRIIISTMEAGIQKGILLQSQYEATQTEMKQDHA